MKNKIYLSRESKKWKGNLHAHTTWSDGSLEASEVVRAFRDKGYDFMSITDHDVFARTEEFDTEQFIVLPGMERGGLNPIPNEDPGYHFGVLDDPTAEADKERFAHLEKFPVPIPWEGAASPQKLIDELREHGNLVIFNHPEWHLTRFEDLVQYKGYFAVEIFNYATEWTPATSYGTAYWDHALQNGQRVFGVAADDSHSHNREAHLADYGGAWVSVESECLTQASIIAGLKEGSFYSSTGPEIHDLRVEDGVLKVECSPCQYIMFKAFPARGPFVADFQNGKLLTSSSMKLKERMIYVRVECIDDKGRVAWSNPVFVRDLLGDEQGEE